MTERNSGRLLSPPRARTLYAIADALVPPGPAGEGERNPGGGGVDVAPLVEARLAYAEPARLRELRLLLFVLEWWPRLTLQHRRGFSWLPRAERLRVLERFQRGRLRRLERASGELRALVLGAAQEALRTYSLPGA